MAKWRLRRDLLEAIPQTNPNAFHPITIYHPLSVWLSSHNLVSQDRAHMTRGCTRSFTTWTSPISLFLGGRPQVRYTWWFRGSTTWPQGTTQHKSILPLPPKCFINLVVFLGFCKTRFSTLSQNMWSSLPKT
jgi:hypothetical protein